MIIRRAFIGSVTGGLLAAPLAGEAQEAGKVYRIGWLTVFPGPALRGLFVEAMRKQGWVEGRDFVLEERFTFENPQNAMAFAVELIGLKADVLVTITTGMAVAAKRASRTIPIVMLTSGYPVEAGLAASLARPGANVTGNTSYAGTALWAKYVELLRELLPGLRRLGVLFDYLPPVLEVGEADLGLAEMRKGAAALRVALRALNIRSTEELTRALAALAREPVDALFCTTGPFLTANASRIIDFALEQRLPTMTDFATTLFLQGCLMAYSANLAELARQAASYVERILRGAKPADLPIQRPAKFDLIINMKTAKALGLTIPQSLLLRADQLFE
jgi:ABC-type uncharacterized transport system substrate-binding protein